MSPTPAEAVAAINEFLVSTGVNFVKLTINSEGVQVLAEVGITGTAVLPLNAFNAVAQYQDLVDNDHYSSSDAAAIAGSNFIGGLAAGFIWDVGGTALTDNPWIGASIGTAVSLFGSHLGSLGFLLGEETENVVSSLSAYLTDLFSPSNPASNILLSNLTSPTGFTATPTPTPGSPAGIYNTSASSQSPDGNSHGIRVSDMLQTESDGYYVVQTGNTLSDIANTFGTTIEAIMQANPSVTNAKMIYAGQQITLPTGATNWLTELGKQGREITDFLKSVTEPMKTVRENMIFNDPEVPEPGDVESTTALKRSSLDALAERVLSRRIWRPEWVPIKNRVITTDIYIRGDRVVFTRTNDMDHHVSVRVHCGRQFNMDSDSAGEPMQNQRGQDDTESEIW